MRDEPRRAQCGERGEKRRAKNGLLRMGEQPRVMDDTVPARAGRIPLCSVGTPWNRRQCKADAAPNIDPEAAVPQRGERVFDRAGVASLRLRVDDQRGREISAQPLVAELYGRAKVA